MRLLSLMICAASLHAGALTIVDFVPPVATEGIQFSGPLANFTDSDPTDTCSTCTSTISWGDGTTSAVGIFPALFPQLTSPFELSGSHTYAEEGAYSVLLMVNEGSGSSATATGTEIVSDAPLTGTAAAPVAFTTNVALTNLLMTFTDGNPNALLSDFSATVNWGDGTTSAGTVSANGRIFDVTGTHTYAQGGTFTVVVTANDIGGSTTSVSTTAAGSAIPEPGTIGMVCVGLALGYARFRRR